MNRIHDSHLPSSRSEAEIPIYRDAFRHSYLLFIFHISLFTVFLSLCLPSIVLAQWEPDVRLTYNDSSSYTSYNNAWCVAATGDTVHVVWTDWRDRNGEIYTKRSLNGGSTWSPDFRLTNNSAGSYHPSVTASAGNVHVVWEDGRAGNFSIYSKRSTDGGTTWEPDLRLSSGGIGSYRPSVVRLGDNVHVVWQQMTVGNYNVICYKHSSDGGTTWDPDLQLTNHSAGSGYPSVAVSGSNVHVVWMDFRDTNWEIYSKRSTDGGATWDPDLRLTNNGGNSSCPSVAAFGSNIHVVWHDDRPGNPEIYTKRCTDGGTTWDPDLRLTNDGASSENSSVAVSGSNVHVIWQDNRDGNYEIYNKRSSDGGTIWGPDTRLTNDGAASYYPSVAASGRRVHVVWQDNRVGNNEIYYKRNPTGNGVEDNKGFEGSRVQGIKITPNPFISFATLPGHEAERFSLYDISGRRVGTYKGDRIGEGLSQGVYFVRREGERRPLARVVKIR